MFTEALSFYKIKDTKTLPSGQTVTTVTLVGTSPKTPKQGERRAKLWFDVDFWGKSGEALTKFLEGKPQWYPIQVSGDIDVEVYKGNDGTPRAAIRLLNASWKAIDMPRPTENAAPETVADEQPTSGGEGYYE